MRWPANRAGAVVRALPHRGRPVVRHHVPFPDPRSGLPSDHPELSAETQSRNLGSPAPAHRPRFPLRDPAPSLRHQAARKIAPPQDLRFRNGPPTDRKPSRLSLKGRPSNLPPDPRPNRIFRIVLLTDPRPNQHCRIARETSPQPNPLCRIDRVTGPPPSRISPTVLRIDLQSSRTNRIAPATHPRTDRMCQTVRSRAIVPSNARKPNPETSIIPTRAAQSSGIARETTRRTALHPIVVRSSADRDKTPARSSGRTSTTRSGPVRVRNPRIGGTPVARTTGLSIVPASTTSTIST